MVYDETVELPVDQEKLIIIIGVIDYHLLVYQVIQQPEVFVQDSAIEDGSFLQMAIVEKRVSVSEREGIFCILASSVKPGFRSDIMVITLQGIAIFVRGGYAVLPGGLTLHC